MLPCFDVLFFRCGLLQLVNLGLNTQVMCRPSSMRPSECREGFYWPPGMVTVPSDSLTPQGTKSSYVPRISAPLAAPCMEIAPEYAQQICVSFQRFPSGARVRRMCNSTFFKLLKYCCSYSWYFSDLSSSFFSLLAL